MTNSLYIDGSQGEGGGQIVRSSLALALVTGRSVTIENIRAARRKPGLLPQHLAAVRAAVAVSHGEATGAVAGSRSLQFAPAVVRGGDYYFNVGTAGSATLVLQTVLPALLIADAPSALILEGGTHNPWAPPFDFLQQAFLSLVSRMGPRVTARLQRHGFYPAGGGRFTVTIEPSSRLVGFHLLERGPLVAWSARALVANLPAHIGQREVNAILHEMGWEPACGRVEEVDAYGPGNAVAAELVSQNVTEVFTAFGRKGVRAEHVAHELVQQVGDYLKAAVPVGPYLADQLLLPLGISAWQTSDDRQRGGSFRTMPLSSHAVTHIDILRQFLDVDIRVDSEGADTCRVSIDPVKSR
jgi:RNA 3'-terminal phosphate cyclase (ATP)